MAHTSWEAGFKYLQLCLGRRQWHPTPVLLPGESHRQRSLVGYSPWGRKELDTTERLHFHFHSASLTTLKPDYVDHNHLTCVLRNLYAGEEATVRTGHGTTDWFKMGQGVHQGWILLPCLLNLYAEYIMWNARLDEAQAGIEMREEISITSDMQLTPLLWQKVKRN